MKKLDLSRDILAINGGSPVRNEGWLDNFTTGQEEKDALCRVIDSGYLSLFEGSHAPTLPFSFRGGPEVQSLELEWCKYYSIKNAVAVNSATSGLYAAIGALNIGYGDEVIVSPYTMTACAMAPLIYGAIPVFADVELESGSLDPISVKKLITSKTKAILVVHQFGIPAKMDEILEIAQKYNIQVIEDCAQGHAAKYRNKYVGTLGDIGVFSLNVNKTIQSGEGGVCITENDELAYRLQLIRNHGEVVIEGAGYKNLTNIAGYNYRMTELEAAVAKEQLKKLNKLNEERIRLVERFYSGISEVQFLKPFLSRKVDKATYYIVPIRYIESIAGEDRSSFVSALNAEGALFYEGYSRPLYLQPVYQEKNLYKHGYPFSAKENIGTQQNYHKGQCIMCEQLYFNEMIVNEHIRPPNTKEDIDDLIKIIKKVAQ